MDILSQLKLIGFTGKGGQLVSDTDYPIKVDFNSVDPTSSKINYGNFIKVHHSGICTFFKPENTVVLECVIWLLRKGYLPQSLELEKNWKLGHKGKGRLDILIRNADVAFGMIECKTWGREYQKERDNILEDGGQLFSYFVQEKTVETLILYTSKVDGDKITRHAEAVDTSSLVGTNSDELHKSWGKSFIPQGIFHDDAQPYLSKKRNLKKSDLKELDRDSGGGLFHSFAEVLRRHVISDKSNAFNKIFSLFVCKICDEDTKGPDDELDFQWRVADTLPKLVTRLTKLYEDGLNNYLAIKIKGEFFSPSSEFAFVDIYDEASFNRNFTIVREVVELLQGYQIRYTSKHQFLGDFFESLLATGLKQEAGQFFTPVPLARFFLRSLPIEGIISQNIQSKRPDVLPFILDYACGAGHFLTEAIDEVEEHIEKINVNQLLGQIQKKFLSIKNNLYWAKDYVYGIEKDYRLAKTTKVALFLNGDGDAIIVNGDGLDDFHLSGTYAGVLKAGASGRLNEQFDIIISNPPFSISGFRKYLSNGKDNFALYGWLSGQSTEIECLFLERVYHLLREGGVCGHNSPIEHPEQ